VRISIIIPALNEAAGISQSIEGAFATQPHEVIVVDGGSTDETVGIAKQHNCRVLQGDRGRASQQNLGARYATGEVLLFLHADNWLAPDGLRQITVALQSSRILGGAFRHRIQAIGLAYRVIEQGNALRARIFRMAYGDQGIFVRRDAFWQLGGFPNVNLMEDVLLMRKLRRMSSLPILPGPIYISARRWEEHGPLRQTIRNWGLTLAESVGVSPDRLARYYPIHSHNSNNTNGTCK